jgi:hypothetical protein
VSLDETTWLDAIAQGATRYVKDFKRRPSQLSGDASAYVGFKATWQGLDTALRKRGYASLAKFLDARKIEDNVKRSRPPTADVELLDAVRRGVARYIEVPCAVEATADCVSFWTQKRSGQPTTSSEAHPARCRGPSIPRRTGVLDV